MFDQFGEIWLVDCEFMCLPGERPVPLCLVGRELRSGKLLRVWFDDSTGPQQCPIPTGPDVLFIAFYASAELGCYLANSWPLPLRIIDLYCEFRNLTNGLSTPCGNGLLGALAWFGLDAIEASEKHELRELAMRGGPYSPAEKLALLDYCQSDVDSLVRLLPKIWPTINVSHALNRGRYMAAIAHMEWNGVPIDADTLRSLREHWTSIRSRLIAAVDADYGVFVPTNSAFDPSTQFGQAVADVAAEWEIDPHELAEAAIMVWQQNRESEQSFLNAKRSARRATGLTSKRLHKWEDDGKDSASWPRLDENARELAGTHPELGIGCGYESGSNADTTDYSGALWELLRDDRDSVLPKHSPAILREAAEMVPRPVSLVVCLNCVSFN